MTIPVIERPVTTDPRELVTPELFNQLANRIAREHLVTPEMAERIVGQALAFLYACAKNPGAGLAPSRAVDIGWHAFILHTREYAEFCERVAGRFIHHTPDDEDGPGRVVDVASRLGATVSAMHAAQLPVDLDLWSVDGDCSQCHAGCHDSPRS